jgi:hypothetical protein
MSLPLVPVTVECSCPGTPHPEDTVLLAPVTDVRIGSAAAAGLGILPSGPSQLSDIEGALSLAFLHFGPRDWTFTDAKGEPLPLTLDNIDERLSFAHGGLEVIEKANELYATDVLGPLLRARQRASLSGPTDDSTSPQSGPGESTDSSDKPSLRAVTGGKRSAARAS